MKVRVYKKSKSSVIISFRFTLPLIKKQVILQSLAIFFISAVGVVGFHALLFANTFSGGSLTFEPIMQNIFVRTVEAGSISNPPIGKLVAYGSREKKQVALTFDADMTYGMKQMLLSGAVRSYYDEQLIRLLQESNTKATLFLAGLWIEAYPDIAQKLAEDTLFELANHSYSHPSFSGECYGLGEISEKDKFEELTKTQELLKKLIHRDNTLFRFPGGCHSEKDLDILKEFGLTAIQWDAAGSDGFNENADAIIANVLNSARNGSIIVLHMNGFPNDPKTAEVLPVIIATLKERGYEFVKVSELLTTLTTHNIIGIKQFLQNGTIL